MAILDEARTKAFLAMASAIAGGELDEPDEAEASADQAEAA
jgi:hypothetical protein